MTALETGARADSRAVLIGVSTYDDETGFAPVPAARNSLRAMRALLCDPLVCGWPPERVTVIDDPGSPTDLENQLADAAEETAGELLVYYVGHGALGLDGELCLSVTTTTVSRPQITGLPWKRVAEILRVSSPARVKVVILDCCFAGQAIEALAAADEGTALADNAHVEGAYTLTATIRNRTAHVPPLATQENACTSFTGELCEAGA